MAVSSGLPVIWHNAWINTTNRGHVADNIMKQGMFKEVAAIRRHGDFLIDAWFKVSSVLLLILYDCFAYLFIGFLDFFPIHVHCCVK